ncbi:REST factor, partial [Atlantisia rogersi]|nr:REST factor [Atlantisia rogersi]
GEKPFKCDQCSYVASNQHEVTRHARQVHNGPKPLTCPHCDYKTADRSNFKKHVELHVNPRQFLCPVCDYAASKKCNLQYHIKSRHPDCSDITMDVSKVKLRTKKSEADFPEGVADKAEKEQGKGDSAAKKNEKGVKVERKDPAAKEKKPLNSVPVGQVTTRSRKTAAESKEMDIKVEKMDEKAPKTKKNKRKVESEGASSKQEPESDTLAGTKKKKKVEAKATECQEAQKSDAAPEEEPKKQHSCLKKNRKKKALRNKQGKKSGKLDQEKTEDEEMPDECPAAEEEDCVKPDAEGSDRSEQDPAAAAAPSGDDDGDGESTDPKGSSAQDPGQVHQPAQNTEAKVEDQEMPLAAAEGGGAREEGKAGGEQDGCSEGAPCAEGSSAVPLDVPPAPAPEKEQEETSLLETVSNSDPMDLSKARLPEPTGDTTPPPTPLEGCPPNPTPPLTFPPPAASEPPEVEEDEGIHSHEGSDISDNLSEGSDDSGLNGARSLPEETGPKAPQGAPSPALPGGSYVCIFCDRSFTQEGEYSKHLNRHLVNVYYLEKATQGQE